MAVIATYLPICLPKAQATCKLIWQQVALKSQAYKRWINQDNVTLRGLDIIRILGETYLSLTIGSFTSTHKIHKAKHFHLGLRLQSELCWF